MSKEVEEYEEQLQKIKEHLQKVILKDYKSQWRVQEEGSIEENQNTPNMS